jgi:hypothetical protein
LEKFTPCSDGCFRTTRKAGGQVCGMYPEESDAQALNGENWKAFTHARRRLRRLTPMRNGHCWRLNCFKASER